MVYHSIIVKLYRAKKIKDQYLKHITDYYGFTSFISDKWKKSRNVNSYDDFVRFIIAAMSDFGNDDVKKYITENADSMASFALNKIGNQYRSESEWILENEELTIPKNSHLSIAINKALEQEAYEWRDAGKPMHPREWALNRILGTMKMIEKTYQEFVAKK